jgi:predicted transcriptional regulator
MLAQKLDLSVGSVKHHVGRLCAHDLVRAKRRGRRFNYRIGPRATIIAGRGKVILNVSTPHGAEATVTMRIA